MNLQAPRRGGLPPPVLGERRSRGVYLRYCPRRDRTTRVSPRGGSTVVEREPAWSVPGMREPRYSQQNAAKSATTPAQAEQRAITALLMATVEDMRRSRGLSLERLADASGITLSAIYRLRERHSDPRLTTVLRLCRGLDVTVGDLLGDLPLPAEAPLRHARISPAAQTGADSLWVP
jgi:DNA-binding Xre family transcriptional regulator